MGSHVTTAMLHEARDMWNDRPGIGSALEEIRDLECRLLGRYRSLLDGLDASDRGDWPVIIAAAIRAGVTDKEMFDEIGCSPATVGRWLHDGVVAGVGTRKLAKKALLDLLDGKLETTPRSPLRERRVVSA